MKAYRGGRQIVICDGCFEEIKSYKAKYHNITVGGKRGFAAHNTKCAKKAKANPPTEIFCTTDGCDLRVATGEPACAGRHPQ